MPTFKPLMKKIQLAIFSGVVATLFLATTAVVVRASVYCLQNCYGGGYGETFWVSCGSSAGNYFALCPADGGPCTVDQGFTQQEADAECARH